MNLPRSTSRSLSLALASLLAACGGEPPPAAAPPAAAPPASASAPPAPAPAPADLDASVAAPVDAAPAAPAVAALASKGVPFPGVTAPVSFDYLVADRAAGKIWVPLSSAGSVALYDVASGKLSTVTGFATTERDVHGKKRTVGPSAAAVGDGVVYVGDRATSEVCVLDPVKAKKGACAKVPSPTDGVAYVASTKEVWVTTPHDHSLTVLDAAHGLKVKGTVKTEGDTEGYAVDEAHGLFFTNLEDKGSTLVIDVKTRAVKATWNAGCSSEGPRGLAFDAADGVLVVACTDHLQALDAAHDGAKLGALPTGSGVDNLDFVDGSGLLFAAAGRDARLTVAHVDAHGQLTLVAQGTTASGARNAVADASGRAYVVDPQGAQLLVLEPQR